MIRFIILTIVTFFSLNLFGQRAVSIKVDGMTCQMCVNHVQKKLSTSKEIEKIKIDLNSGWVSFFVKKGVKPNKKKYTELIESAGYSSVEYLLDQAALDKRNQMAKS